MEKSRAAKKETKPVPKQKITTFSCTCGSVGYSTMQSIMQANERKSGGRKSEATGLGCTCNGKKYEKITITSSNDPWKDPELARQMERDMEEIAAKFEPTRYIDPDEMKLIDVESPVSRLRHDINRMFDVIDATFR